MKAQKGYQCKGSADARSRCSGCCSYCEYGCRDPYGLHKDEEYYVPHRADNSIYVPSHYRPFISDADLRDGNVVLY